MKRGMGPLIPLAASLLLLLPALALALPLPAPPEPTDRFALALRDSDGRLVEIQAKLKSPDREDLPAGDLVVLLRYQTWTAQGAPLYRIAAPHPLAIASLSAAHPVLLRFSFSPALALTDLIHPHLKIVYRASRNRAPPAAPRRLLKEFFTEEILFGSTAPLTQTPVSPPALASPGTVLFGPVTFMRTRGAPTPDILSFPVSDTTGPFLLQLTNGTAGGSHRVSSAVVTLNGQPIFHPRDFNKKVAGLEEQIVLQPTNTLTVELRGGPATRLTLQIVKLTQRSCRALGPRTFTRQTGKPVVEEVSFPQAPQLTGPFTLTLTSGDAAGQHRVDSTVITLNGQTVVVPSDVNEQVSRLSRTVDLLPTNTLTVELRGAPGDFLTLEITGFDTVPPQVRITSPAPGAFFSESPITVSGTVDDPTVSVVVIPQTTQPAIVAPVRPDGTWTATGVSLQEGENPITARATDPCGNTGEDTVTVTLRTLPAPPTVELRLKEERITNDPVALVVGTVSDPEATVTVQGEVVTNIDGFFSASVPLMEGLNTITATATDAFGQTGTARVTITLDTVAPVLTLTGPAEGTVTAAAAITVRGTIDDPTATVFVNGEPVAVTDSLFSANVPLEEGENVIFVDAVDAAFNFTLLDLTVTRDSQSPVVTITAPLDGAGVTEPTITLSGTITDATAISLAVTHRGVTQSLSVPTGSFSVPLTLLSGLNTITLTATDQAGHTASAQLRVTLVAAGTTTVTGRVISDTLGSPLAGATVTVPFTSLLALTGPEGRFTLSNVPAGNELLTAARPGYLTRSVSIAVPPAGTLDVGDIALSPPPSAPGTITFSGVVRDGTTGAPLASVNVLRTSTGLDGTFLIRDLTPGFYGVSFARAGYEPVLIPLQFYSTNTIFRIEMRPTTGTLRGTITAAATGAPLVGVLVTVTTSGGTVSTTSGTDGRYTIAGLLPGAMSGTVTKAGFAPASFSGTVVAGGVMVGDVALTALPTTATVTGTVTDASTTSPLADVAVAVTDPIRTLTTTTGADGRYTISGVTPGELTGSMTRSGFAGALFSTRVEAGVTLTVNAALTPLPATPPPPALQTVTLTGLVTRADTGAALAGATLMATSGTTTLTTTSGAEGRYILSGIPPGPLTIAVSAAGFFRQSFQTTASGGTVPLDVALVPSPFAVTITSPADGALINQDRVTVRGTVTTGFAPEVGVVVNGVLAFVSGDQWIAEVPLTQGTNALTATATAAGGQAISRSVTVRTDAPREPLLVLRASPVSGLSPLTVRFTVESALPRPIVHFAFDVNGDGTVDLTADLTGRTFTHVEATYTGAQLVTPTLTVTDDLGQSVTAQTVVQVLDLSDTVAMLQGKWTALRDALAGQDIEGALQTIAGGIRTRYRPALQALGVDLPTIAATLGNIQIISVQEGVAEAATVRIEDGQRRVYFIYFVPDNDGIWRILGM